MRPARSSRSQSFRYRAQVPEVSSISQRAIGISHFVLIIGLLLWIIVAPFCVASQEQSLIAGTSDADIRL